MKKTNACGDKKLNLLEEGTELKLDFSKLERAAVTRAGILPVAIQHADTGEVLLVAYTNAQAFHLAMQARRLILWSTSRNELWEKGKTSGETFDLVEARVNCEQNALLYRVRPRRNGICHTRNRSAQPRNCFYRRICPATLALENLDP